MDDAVQPEVVGEQSPIRQFNLLGFLDPFPCRLLVQAQKNAAEPEVSFSPVRPIPQRPLERRPHPFKVVPGEVPPVRCRHQGPWQREAGTRNPGLGPGQSESVNGGGQAQADHDEVDQAGGNGPRRHRFRIGAGPAGLAQPADVGAEDHGGDCDPGDVQGEIAQALDRQGQAAKQAPKDQGGASGEAAATQARNPSRAIDARASRVRLCPTTPPSTSICTYSFSE